METIYSQIQANKDSLKQVLDGKQLSFKAAANILSSNFTGSTSTHIDPEVQTLITIPPTQAQSVLDYFPKISVNSHTIVTVKQEADDDDGTFSSVSEGATKENVDSDVRATQKSFTKYAAYIKVSEEMVSDVSFINAMIQSTLNRRIKNKIAADFTAAIVAATPGVAASNLTAGTNIGANEFGKIFAPIYAGMKFNKGYTPNLWLLNEPDYTSVYNSSTNSEWMEQNEPIIVPCAAVTAGSIVALDTNLFPLYIYKDVNFEIGRSSDDFTKNIFTIRAEARVTWDMTGESLNALFRDTIANIITQC